MAVNPIYVLQILTGLGLLAHSIPKLMNIQSTMHSFKKMGYGSFMGVVVTAIENIGALFLILAVFPRVSAAFLGLTMLGAMSYHWRKKEGFKGGWEAAYLYLMACIVIILGGISPWGLGF